MAKTESTAVNQLISNLQTQRPLPVDPSEDLLFKMPAPVSVPVERRSRPRTSPTSSTPAAREVQPLPRAANGTAEHGAVRMSAPQPRGATIPPLPKAAQESRSGIPLPRVSAPISSPASNPNITLPPLPTTLLKVDAERPSAKLPPPPRSLPRPSNQMNAQGTPAPELARRSPPPASMPVAAPYTAPIPVALPNAPAVAATPKRPTPAGVPVRPLTDMTSNQAWFEPTPIADDLEPGGNTEHVPTQASATTALLGKLAVPMIGLVVIGIFVGGYVAFSGEGGKAHHGIKQAAAPTTPAPVAITAPAAVAETAPATVAVPTTPAVVPADQIVATMTRSPAPALPPPPAADAVAAAVPAPATETAVPAAITPTARGVQLVDVRIDSQPMGATVMLIDRGKTSFLGTTPLAASLDGARRYDLVFTYDNQPTQIEHLDPRITHHVAVVLGKHAAPAPAMPAVAQPVVRATEQKKPAAAPAVAQPVVAAAEKKEPKKPAAPAMAEPTAAHAEEKAAAPVATHAPKSDGAVEQAPPAAMVAAPPAAKGTLMISSKPPCEIIIDGTPTGLTTPQRSIALAPGNHKITLVSASDPSVKKTVTVGVTAGKPTKVIQDLMK